MKYHRLLHSVGLAAMLAVLALLVLPAPARAEAPQVTVECDETADISKQQSIYLTVDITGPAADYISVDWEIVEFDRRQYVRTDSIEEPGTTHWEASCSPRFGTEGYACVYILWPDGTEKSIEKHFTLTGGVKPAQDLTVEAKLDKEKVELGQEIALEFSAAGGIGPYSYKVDWFTESGSKGEPENSGWAGDYHRSTYIAQGGSSGDVTVTVWDSMRRSRHVTLPFQIETYGYPAIVLGKVSFDKDSVAVDRGESITASWSAEGGSGDLVYSYSWAVADAMYEGSQVLMDMKSSDGYVNGTSSTFAPKFGQVVHLRLSVRDRKTGVSFDWNPIEIRLTGGSTTPIALEVKLDNPPAAVGKPARISWTAKGGDGGNLYWVEKWHAVEGHIVFEKQLMKDISETSLTYTPEAAGYVHLHVYARDKVGRVSCYGGLISFNVPGNSDAGPGDADKDGILTISDVISILDYLINEAECASPANADANGSGQIDLLDAEWVIQQIVN